MGYYDVFLTGLFLNILFSVQGCERSLEVRGVEDVCWTKKVEVIERIQHTGKSVINFAKKTLGMDAEETKEPQKCDYYYCIFHELKMINEDDYPCYHKITNWVKNNVIYNHAMILLPRIEACSKELYKNVGSNTYFSTDVLDGTPDSDENDSPGELQGHCEVAAEYMKCMSVVEKNEKMSCPVFQYP